METSNTSTSDTSSGYNPTVITRENSPSQRITDLQGRIYAIAHKFNLYEHTYDDIAHYMIECLLSKCAGDPGFINQDDGYWLRYANWMGYHFLYKTNRYAQTFVRCSDILAVEFDPEANPEKAYKLSELWKVINSLPPHNRKLAVMLIVGYTKSEIAHILGISRPAISQRLSTIKKELSPLFQ